jgi:hypothetical protein
MSLHFKKRFVITIIISRLYVWRFSVSNTVSNAEEQSDMEIYFQIDLTFVSQKFFSYFVFLFYLKTPPLNQAISRLDNEV